MVKENEFSQDFAAEIEALTISDVSFSDKLKQIEILRSGSMNNNKTYFYLDVFESTLSASNEYWKTSNSKAAKAVRLNGDSQVIAADAVGAALGLFGGPLWSIIQGAVVSIAVSEDLKNNNNSDLTLTAEEIASYHNIAVRLYESSISETNQTKLSVMDILGSVQNLMKINHPDLMENFTVPDRANFLNSDYVIDTSTSDHTSFD